MKPLDAPGPCSTAQDSDNSRPDSLPDRAACARAAAASETSFTRTFGDQLAAEELYYSTTIYPLLDRILAGLLLGLGILAVHGGGLRWWTLMWFPLSAAEALGVAAAARLALGLLLRPATGRGQTVSVTASEQGLAMRVMGAELRLPWENCRALLENERLLLVVWGSWRYMAVPKRAFARDQDLVDFRRMILDRASMGARTAGSSE